MGDNVVYAKHDSISLRKAPTGIQGLDEVTNGGLPRDRNTLVVGNAGSGKTILSLEFLINGARYFEEPGVFVTFEESKQDLLENCAGLNFDLGELVRQKLIYIDEVLVDPEEIIELGKYNFGGLEARIEYAIDSIGAKRVVLDTVEALLVRFEDSGRLRSEISRLFGWLKSKGVTTIVTAERVTSDNLTKRGIEEYVSDCVIDLQQMMREKILTRQLRIVKYRGSDHGTNEYPFLLTNNGVEVFPVTTLELKHPAATERISTGVSGLDDMLAGRGVFRGSSILVSGTAGSGKTSLAGSFAQATGDRGERCLYLSFEESEEQILRNIGSIGIDLAPIMRSGLLRFHSSRPTICGLEMHLARIQSLVKEFQPNTMVLDPISNMTIVGSELEVRSTLMRTLDFLKSNQITVLCTALSPGAEDPEETTVGISSIMDTWFLMRNIEENGERNRCLFILKSRGQNHSNQVREFVLSDKGIELMAPYVSDGRIYTGSAKKTHQAIEAADEAARQVLIMRETNSLQQRLEQFENLRVGIESKLRTAKSELEGYRLQIEAEDKARKLMNKTQNQSRLAND